MKQKMALTPFGWLTKADYARRLMQEFGTHVLPCNEHCENECVFKDVGVGCGCPLNEFEDRVLEALGEEL